MAEKKPELYPEWKKLLKFCIEKDIPPWVFAGVTQYFKGWTAATAEERVERAEKIAKGSLLRLEERQAEIEQRTAERQKEMSNTSEQ